MVKDLPARNLPTPVRGNFTAKVLQHMLYLYSGNCNVTDSTNQLAVAYQYISKRKKSVFTRKSHEYLGIHTPSQLKPESCGKGDQPLE